MGQQAKGKTETKEAIRTSLMILNMMRPDIQKTANDIHKELTNEGVELSQRTIYHRLNLLCNYFPQLIVVNKRMPPYGYKRPTNIKKNSSMSPSEAVAISMADQYLNTILPKFSENMSSYLLEAVDVLNETYSQKYQNWLKKVSFSQEQFSLMPAKIDPIVLMNIHLAILGNKDLELVYNSRKKGNKKVEFNVVPVGIAHRGRLSYLLGYFPDKERCYLPINRIISCNEGDKLISKYDHSLKDFEKDKILEFSHKEKIKVKLKFNKNAGYIFKETPISKTQKITEKGEFVLIEDEVIFTESFFFWLCSFGNNVEVMQPAFLKKRLIDTLKSALDNYEK